MAEEASKTTKVSVTVPSDLPLPPVLGANFFHFTTIGMEIQFLVGSVNLLQLHEAKKQGESVLILPDISHRFLLSSFGFEQLKRQIEEISKSVKPSGIPTETESSE